MTGPQHRRPRADAERNRHRVLAAATRLVSEQGPEVPYLEIAEAAEVGVGTVYRHFPRREDLVEAIYRTDLERLCGMAPDLLADNPPLTALKLWMAHFVEHITRKMGLHEALDMAIAAGEDPYHDAQQQLTDALGTLLEATCRAGITRPDISADDAILALSGTALACGATTGPDQQQRLLNLFLAGISTSTRRPPVSLRTDQ